MLSLAQRLGGHHCDTLRSWALLADALAQQGSFGQAEEIMAAVLNRSIDALGEDDENTLFALNTLGNILRWQHKNIEAQEILRQADNFTK